MRANVGGALKMKNYKSLKYKGFKGGFLIRVFPILKR
tara:strand:+ start:2816 stop:2926 length:111 start_codon:yes stop_codon:yes gene_type:complete